LPLFERLTKAEPNSATNWRGQFEAKAAKDGAKAALDLLKKMPPAVLKTLMSGMGFELTVASAYLEAGNTLEAEKVVTLAMAQLKADASALTGDEKLQLARSHPEFRASSPINPNDSSSQRAAHTRRPGEARWMKRATEIDRAIVNGNRPLGRRLRSPKLASQQSVVRAQWFPQPTAIFINQLRRRL